jgi:hypothetical protein
MISSTSLLTLPRILSFVALIPSGQAVMVAEISIKLARLEESFMAPRPLSNQWSFPSTTSTINRDVRQPPPDLSTVKMERRENRFEFQSPAPVSRTPRDKLFLPVGERQCIILMCLEECLDEDKSQDVGERIPGKRVRVAKPTPVSDRRQDNEEHELFFKSVS